MRSKKIDIVQRREFIFSMCRDKSVLHLGCTNFPYTRQTIESSSLLHHELESIASELYGFDFDEEGISILEQHGSNDLYKVDLEHLENVGLSRTFDVIIAGEMIEHLNNPGLFLSGIKRFMNNETLLIITTVNAYCGMRFFQYAFRGKGGINEPVHPDHISYYSYATLSRILDRHDLGIDNFVFYDLGDEHRPFARPLAKLANDICVWFFPQLADGVIAVCRLKA